MTAETAEAVGATKETLTNNAGNVVVIALADLKADPNNLRVHTGRQHDLLKDSLTKYGQPRNIVINTQGMVIAGNGVFAAAKDLGWTHISAHVFDGDEEAQANYALLDNRLAELSYFDKKKLAKRLGTVTPEAQAFLGFSSDEMATLFKGSGEQPKFDKGTEFDPNKIEGEADADAPAESKVKFMQLFVPLNVAEEFEAIVQKLSERFNTDNLTDTVLEAVRRVLAQG